MQTSDSRQPPFCELDPEAVRAVLTGATAKFTAKPPPEWPAYFRDVFGLGGLVRRTFRDPDTLHHFEASPDYLDLLAFLARLREAPCVREKTQGAVVTVRIPGAFLDVLRVQAHEYRASMNTLCVSKLLLFAPTDFVPPDTRRKT